MEYRVEKVLKNIRLSEKIYELSIKGSFLGKPGQFYMLRCWNNEPLLSRPISIHSIDKDKITFLYAVVGQGTEILSHIKTGEDIKILGPLGNGFPIKSIMGKIAIITGGIGIAPMYYVAKQLKSKGANVELYSGFKDLVYGIEKFKDYVNKAYISSETGNIGYKGYVTDMFEASKYDVVLCCGPEVMMEKVVYMCKEANVPVYVSMEKRMACGVGACLVCTCKTKSGNKRTCKDGPVFLGDEVYD